MKRLVVVALVVAACKSHTPPAPAQPDAAPMVVLKPPAPRRPPERSPHLAIVTSLASGAIPVQQVVDPMHGIALGLLIVPATGDKETNSATHICGQAPIDSIQQVVDAAKSSPTCKADPAACAWRCDELECEMVDGTDEWATHWTLHFDGDKIDSVIETSGGGARDKEQLDARIASLRGQDCPPPK